MNPKTPTTGDGLLAAILANPADNHARLVYADWLQENGDEARAHFLRAQIADDPDLREWVRKQIVAHQVQWIGAALAEVICRQIDARVIDMKDLLSGAPFPTIEWRRGFVETLNCTFADWDALADQILREHPVNFVRWRIFTQGDRRALLLRAKEQGVPTHARYYTSIAAQVWMGVGFEQSNRNLRPRAGYDFEPPLQIIVDPRHFIRPGGV